MQMQRKRIALLLLIFLLIAVVTVSFLNVNPASKSVPLQVAKGASLLWEKTYGGTGDDRCFYLVNAGNGYVVAGSSTSFEIGKTVAWIVRLDQDGNALWNRTYNENFGGEFRYVTDLDDGFLIVGNTFTTLGSTNGYVLKIDNNGNPIWNITLQANCGVNKLFSAAKIQGGFVLVGLTQQTGNGNSKVWLVKIDSEGNVIWNKSYGDSADSAGRGVTLTADGCYMVAGYTDGATNEDYDFLVLKIDAAGALLWNRTYGGLESDKAYGIAPAVDGSIIAGDTRSKGAGDSDAWIIKIDLNGNFVWDKTFGGEGFDVPTCITPLSNGDYLVGGITFSFGNGQRDFWLFKINNAGRALWSCTVGRSSYEEAYAVVQNAEDMFLGDKYVMAGWTNSIGQGKYDFYIVKLEVPSEN
jgi:hypothetical protein